MKTYKRIVALVAIVITLASCISNANPVHAANYSIKNNGLNGVYIDINSSPFTSTEKRMASLKRACTWFVSARVKQLTGVYPEINGGQWWWKQANTSNGYYGFKAISGNPTGKAVVCYTNHVSVVEAFDGNVYTISEGGNGAGKESEKYCQITTRSLSQIKNLGGSSGSFLGFVNLGIPFSKKDSESPIIKNAGINDITGTGFNVSCVVTDNVGVDRVLFPTWTIINGQDDLIWHQGEFKNGKWSCHINLSQHKGETGPYITHIYAYDKVGNSSMKAVDEYRMVSYAKRLTLSASSMQMFTGDTFQLNAIMSPSDAVDEVLWSSSNPNVATVKGGRVKAVNKGSTVIRAEFGNDNGYFWSDCTVTVTEKETAKHPMVSYAQNVTLSDSSIQMYTDDTYQLNAILSPSDAVDEVLWSSSDPDVATVNDGRVTAINSGSAVIKAEFSNNNGYFWSTCTVIINEKSNGSDERTDTDLSNTSDVTPLDDNNQTEEDSASCIADTATESMEEQRYDQEDDVIRSRTVYAKDIYLDTSSIQMNTGDTEYINATIYPFNATETTVYWSSSDESVAVVENGIVKAVGEGTAIITASLSHAFADRKWFETCKINVSSVDPYCNSANECVISSDVDNRLKEGKYKAPGITALETVWYDGENIVSTYGDRNKIFVPYGENEYRYYEDNYSYTVTVTSPTSYTYVIRNVETNAIRMRLYYEYYD